jgi:hypothetical protein
MLILYPVTFLKMFIRCMNFLVECLGLLIMGSYHVTSSFSICILFISFSWIIALARNSSTIQNKNGERGYLFLVPEFRGGDFSFSPCIHCHIHLSYIAFIIFLVSVSESSHSSTLSSGSDSLSSTWSSLLAWLSTELLSFSPLDTRSGTVRRVGLRVSPKTSHMFGCFFDSELLKTWDFLFPFQVPGYIRGHIWL